jgi:transcriptional regulator with XRE-family HTH domain
LLNSSKKALEFKITQDELAFKFGVRLRFIRELEQGRTTLKLDKVNRLLDLFGVTLT